jgi:hypothetical protein
VHEFKSVIDFLEQHSMRNQIVDVNLARPYANPRLLALRRIVNMRHRREGGVAVVLA